jgi:hypothetical protein
MSPEKGAATYCTTKILCGNLMLFILLRLVLVVSPGTLRKSVLSSENLIRAIQDLGQVVTRSARGVPRINPPTLSHAYGSRLVRPQYSPQGESRFRTGFARTHQN